MKLLRLCPNKIRELSEQRRKEIPEMQYVTQETGKSKSQDSSCAEYGTIQSKRKDNSKKDVPKGREGENMGERGKELRYVWPQKRVFYYRQKREGDKWKQIKQQNRKRKFPKKEKKKPGKNKKLHKKER